MTTILQVRGVSKRYASGHQALKSVDLDIQRGELFALLGPNGAGKTTLIGMICGLVAPSAGQILLDGQDLATAPRSLRQRIGLVPQEISTDAFETVWATVRFSRGLFGKPPDDAMLERILRQLTLWDKCDAKIMSLSGGMKRRVMIAKALAHEPDLLFLDEPTAGVDVALRREMWEMVRALRAAGVTIILTTHYLEEAEDMADRIGVIRQGELILVEEKRALLQRLGQKELRLHLAQPLSVLPESLAREPALQLSADGAVLVFTYRGTAEQAGVPALLQQVSAAGVAYAELETRQSSLEEIFVQLVAETASA